MSIVKIDPPMKVMSLVDDGFATKGRWMYADRFNSTEKTWRMRLDSRLQFSWYYRTTFMTLQEYREEQL